MGCSTLVHSISGDACHANSMKTASEENPTYSRKENTPNYSREGRGERNTRGRVQTLEATICFCVPSPLSALQGPLQLASPLLEIKFDYSLELVWILLLDYENKDTCWLGPEGILQEATPLDYLMCNILTYTQQTGSFSLTPPPSLVNCSEKCPVFLLVSRIVD